MYIKYLNIQHDYEKMNCVSILAKFYKEQLNIDISEEEKLFNNFSILDLRDLRNISVDTIFNLKNWIKIDLTAMQEFDIIVYTKNNKLSHFSMYVGNYKILDLREKQKSVLRHLNDTTRGNIESCLRHKQLAT